MPGMNLTRQEAQERAAIVTEVHSYDVNLDLMQGKKIFRSETTVKFSAVPGKATFIDAITDKVHSITLNGKELDPAKYADNVRIQIPETEEENELKIVTDAIYTHSGEGLHILTDPADNETYVYSQFEVPDSRRVYAVFEQPDLKSKFTFSVRVPDHWKMISNAPTPKPEKLGDGTARWEFPPTKRMSSYITALVGGPFESVHDELTSTSGCTIPLGIYARKSMFKYLDHKNIFDLTKEGFKFYEETYKTPYPFEKYDQLFVPDFNAGAMENAGCVTFREFYIFRSRVSDAIIERRAVTILHELAHMWFGDLVTMKWWNDLWLNESFAEFMSTLCMVEGTKDWTHAWTTFAIQEKTWAYRQDQLSSTHPIMANIRDLDDIQVNFDGITYAKGASVLRQLVAWVGQDNFMEAIVEYFNKHSWGNTELSDLMIELERTSGRNLKKWTQKWLESEGVNVLSIGIDVDDDGTIQHFAIKQGNDKLSKTLRPHRLRIGFYNVKDGNRVVRDKFFEGDIHGAYTEIDEIVGEKRPDFILINDQDFAYAKVVFDEESLQFVKENPAKFDDPLARAIIWTNIWEMVRDAKFSPIDYIRLILESISHEDQSAIIMILLRHIDTAVQFFIPEEKLPPIKERIADTMFKLFIDAQDMPDLQYQLLATFSNYAISDQHLNFIENFLDKKIRFENLPVDPDLRWTLFHALVAAGRAGEKEIAEIAEKDNTTTGQAKAALSYAAIPTTEAKEKAWKELTSNQDLSNTMIEYTGLGFQRTNDNKILEPFIDSYFEVIGAIWESRSHEIGQYIIELGFPSYAVSDKTITRVDTWLAQNPDAPAGLIRHLTEFKDSMSRAMEVRKIA
ncbi:MAG: aminopeptidase N [Micrococcaceae bacterium]